MATKVTGDLGETIASGFVKRQGFQIITRNYRKKWGELDIVAVKDDTIHFFEVKSTKVSRFTQLTDKKSHTVGYRPEEHVHQAKMARLRRIIQTYLAEVGRGPECIFFVHVLVVRIDMKQRTSRIRWIKNVVL